MSGVCRCGGLLFPQYGDGEWECAACREKREETLPSAVEPKPGETWPPAAGRIGGVGFGLEICLAHFEPEPCPTCAAYIAAGL